jgi:hypothetical protein
MSENRLRPVTVCSRCLTASCWHGEYMCNDARDAGVVQKTRGELDALRLEHPDNYSDAKLLAVCGMLEETS